MANGKLHNLFHKVVTGLKHSRSSRLMPRFTSLALEVKARRPD
jgi:hypothetical protein